MEKNKITINYSFHFKGILNTANSVSLKFRSDSNSDKNFSACCVCSSVKLMVKFSLLINLKIFFLYSYLSQKNC